MTIDEFLDRYEVKNDAALAELANLTRSAMSKRRDKGWRIDYYSLNGELLIGWLNPDGDLIFKGYQ